MAPTRRFIACQLPTRRVMRNFETRIWHLALPWQSQQKLLANPQKSWDAFVEVTFLELQRKRERAGHRVVWWPVGSGPSHNDNTSRDISPPSWLTYIFVMGQFQWEDSSLMSKNCRELFCWGKKPSNSETTAIIGRNNLLPLSNHVHQDGFPLDKTACNQIQLHGVLILVFDASVCLCLLFLLCCFRKRCSSAVEFP